jgi:hypothetical protein
MGTKPKNDAVRRVVLMVVLALVVAALLVRRFAILIR